MASSFSKGLIAAVRNDIDIIQGEQEIAATACIGVREELGVPVIASLHNIWPEELVAMGLVEETSKEYDALQEFEQNIVSGSDLVVVVSEDMARYVETRYSSKSGHILVVPPGGRSRVSQIGNRTMPYKIIYAGLVEKRAHPDLFVESMPHVIAERPNVRFFITNRGEELGRIRNLAHKAGVSPEYYWFPRSDEFYKFLASCHVGVVTSSDDLPRRMGPPVKLFDYLSVGLPVVANDIGGWTKIIEHEEIGILTDSDPQSLADGILKLIGNEGLSRRLGEKGLELVKSKLNWDESAKILLHEYARLC
jgi:glycosyltransferase involved in cell wall biosynthesis